MTELFEEEKLAFALQTELRRIGLLCSVTGAGVHWRCAVTSNGRRTDTACFSAQGHEYLTSFIEGEGSEVWGRTARVSDVVGAVRRWAEGVPLDALLREFPFVEAKRRGLERLLNDARRLDPDIGERVSASVVRVGCDLHRLTCTAGDRSVDMHFNGDNETPDAVLSWNQGVVARWLVRPEDLARALRSWLIENVGAVDIGDKFPDLRLRRVAPYYDRGEFLIGDFVVSWDEVEEFYAELRYPEAGLTIQLIASLRSAGFDRTLRAGQSLATLILSRSRRHGLKRDQPSISIAVSGDTVVASSNPSGAVISETQGPEVSAELLGALRELEALDVS